MGEVHQGSAAKRGQVESSAVEDRLLVLLDGDHAATREIIDLALEQYVKISAHLAVIIREGDLPALRNCAHTLAASWQMLADRSADDGLLHTVQSAARQQSPSAVEHARALRDRVQSVLLQLILTVATRSGSVAGDEDGR